MSLVSENFIYLLPNSPVISETAYSTIRLGCYLAQRNTIQLLTYVEVDMECY